RSKRRNLSFPPAGKYQENEFIRGKTLYAAYGRESFYGSDEKTDNYGKGLDSSWCRNFHVYTSDHDCYGGCSGCPSGIRVPLFYRGRTSGCLLSAGIFSDKNVRVGGICSCCARRNRSC